MSSLGLPSGVVRLVTYDLAWPSMFTAEAARLELLLATRGVVLQLEHTGSTAVPGLDAKPVLDLLAGWQGTGSRPAAVHALQAAGYDYRGEQGIPGRDFFRRGEPRQFHLHLTAVGSAFWHDHLSFRDYLRANPEVAASYADLKRELAARYPTDRERYIEGKTAFVTAVLARAAGVQGA